MAKTIRCSRCDNGSVVELEMSTKTGQKLALASCTRCETRTWTSDGEPVEVQDVLKLTSGDPDFVVTPSGRKSPRTRSAR